MHFNNLISSSEQTSKQMVTTVFPLGCTVFSVQTTFSTTIDRTQKSTTYPETSRSFNEKQITEVLAVMNEMSHESRVKFAEKEKKKRKKEAF